MFKTILWTGRMCTCSGSWVNDNRFIIGYYSLYQHGYLGINADDQSDRVQSMLDVIQ